VPVKRIHPGGFIPIELKHGKLTDLSHDAFPSRLSGWAGDDLRLEADGTHFGYVYEGEAVCESEAGSFRLKPGMYFALPGAGGVAGTGRGIVVTRLGYRGVFGLGGPVEPVGRLRYIDGCTDSLLVPPVMMGDPCLNALYFPPGIVQTEHTHPSIRVGLVAAGSGECITPDARFALLAGQVFVITAESPHCFTTAGGEMVVIAYHPDSDFGPTDEEHPMVNRTIVGGVPAKI
jgi:hypothetical protein